MSDEFTKIIGGLLCLAVGGLVGWVWALWKSHYDHKEHVATNYVHNKVLNQVRREVRYLRDISLAIARTLRVHVPPEEHRASDDDEQ